MKIIINKDFNKITLYFQAKKEQHINIRAAFIHVLGDLLQSVGVLISSIIIKFKPNYMWADPACTILFSVIVFCTTLTIAKDTVHILIEGYPKSLDPHVVYLVGSDKFCHMDLSSLDIPQLRCEL